MSESKHTPGPWHQEKGSEGSCKWVKVEKIGDLIEGLILYEVEHRGGAFSYIKCDIAHAIQTVFPAAKNLRYLQESK